MYQIGPGPLFLHLFTCDGKKMYLKVPVVLHWELMLLERKPYVPDVAGFFWNSHIGSLALSL